jgi:hypothetical protein
MFNPNKRTFGDEEYREQPPMEYDDRPAKQAKVADQSTCWPQYQPGCGYRAWRFSQYDRVRCNVGGELGWVSGNVQALNEPSESSVLPYVVVLWACPLLGLVKHFRPSW